MVKGEGNYNFTVIIFLLKKISVRSKLLKFSPLWGSKWTWYSQALEKYWTSFEESHADCLSQRNIKVIFYLLYILFLSLCLEYSLMCPHVFLPSSHWEKVLVNFESFLTILRKTIFSQYVTQGIFLIIVNFFKSRKLQENPFQLCVL